MGGGIVLVQQQRRPAELLRPGWAPPPWLFGPVWTLLYTLMAIAAWLVWRRGGFRAARLALTLFLAQLVFNAAWSWLFFAWRLATGMPEAEARNLVLLLMVMFENAHALNARSERRSVLGIPLSANWFLVSAIAGAHGLHIAAMFVPWLGDTLRITPVGLLDWAMVGALAISLLLVMEAFKRVAATWDGGAG